MILYKYKSLDNLDHILDIIFNERLYCAPYAKLNDPFEGLFFSLQTVSFPVAFPANFKDLKNVDMLILKSHKKISSLSESLDSNLLWAHYADGHKGLAIELELPVSAYLKRIEYVSNLKEFGDTILTSPSAEEVLSHKLDVWQYEKEWRVFSEDEYYSIPNAIRSIYVGVHMNDSKKNLLRKVVPEEIPIFSTKINPLKNSIVIGDLIQATE